MLRYNLRELETISLLIGTRQFIRTGYTSFACLTLFVPSLAARSRGVISSPLVIPVGDIPAVSGRWLVHALIVSGQIKRYRREWNMRETLVLYICENPSSNARWYPFISLSSKEVDEWMETLSYLLVSLAIIPKAVFCSAAEPQHGQYLVMVICAHQLEITSGVKRGRVYVYIHLHLRYLIILYHLTFTVCISHSRNPFPTNVKLNRSLSKRYTRT